MIESTVCVTGASGQLGRRVIELLLAAGSAGSIIAATRSPEKIADLAEQGVTVRFADFDQPAYLPDAFAGVDRLLLISTTTIDDGRTRQHTNAIEAASQAGVKHIVYTSLINPIDTPVTLAPSHAATEAALATSSLGWTVLRNNIYLESAVQSVQQALQMGGKLANAVGDGRQAFVAREDCAQAAAAALLDGFDGRRTLDITGAEALSPTDLARLASQITGTAVEYLPLTAEALRQNLTAVGLPTPVIDLVVSFDEAAAQGKFENVSPDFQTLTGRQQLRAADLLAKQLAKS